MLRQHLALQQRLINSRNVFQFVCFSYTVHVLTEKLKRDGIFPRGSGDVHYHDGVLAAVAMNNVGIKVHL